MARWIYQNAPETQLHPFRVGLFSKILKCFSSAGALSNTAQYDYKMQGQY